MLAKIRLFLEKSGFNWLGKYWGKNTQYKNIRIYNKKRLIFRKKRFFVVVNYDVIILSVQAF